MKISQREARRLRKRVAELDSILDAQKRQFSSNWPSSVVIARVVLPEVEMAKITTARLLKHGVVAVPDGHVIQFFASKL